MTLKVGVIGAGGIAQIAHIPCWQKSGQAEVYAVCDLNETKLNDVKERFGIPHAFTDFQQLLEMEEIDAVSICTPNLLHVPMSIEALRAGKHVLCEKPIAVKGSDAVRLMEEARRSGKVFMGAFCSRFTDQAAFMKRLVERGELGDVYYVKAGSVRRRGIPGLGGWFTTKSLSGGGCMLDIGVHALDRAYWLMGAPEPLGVAGSVYQKFKEVAVDGGWPPMNTRLGDIFSGTNDVEDLANAYIRFQGGISMVLEASWAAHTQPQNYLELLGTKAGVRQDSQGVVMLTEKEGQLLDVTPKLGDRDGYANEIAHFIECIQENKQPLTTPEEIINVSYMIEGVYVSSDLGREVTLSDLKGEGE